MNDRNRLTEVPMARVLALLLLTACTPARLATLSAADTTLAVELRETLAAAEDEVALARMEAVRVRIALDEVTTIVEATAEVLTAREAAGEAFAELGSARVHHREAQLEAGRARIRAGLARQALSRAETAIRAGRFVVKLTPLQREIASTEEDLATARAASERLRLVVEDATAEAWARYAELTDAEAARQLWLALATD